MKVSPAPKSLTFLTLQKILEISKWPWEEKILNVKFILLMLALGNYIRKIYLKKTLNNLKKLLSPRFGNWNLRMLISCKL